MATQPHLIKPVPNVQIAAHHPKDQLVLQSAIFHLAQPAATVRVRIHILQIAITVTSYLINVMY